MSWRFTFDPFLVVPVCTVAANPSGSLLSPEGRPPVTFRPAHDLRSLDFEFPDPDTFVTLTVVAGAAGVPEITLDDERERPVLIGAVSRDSADVLEEYRDGDRLAFAMPDQMAFGYA